MKKVVIDQHTLKYEVSDHDTLEYPMTQSRKKSATESIINVLIGYCVAILSQIVIFPMFGIYIPIADNFGIAAYFTIISLIRSYIVRRWFNGLLERTDNRSV